MTMSRPLPVVIVSLPPTPGAVVVISPSVTGSVPNCGAFGVPAVISPLSPMTTLKPLPAEIVSPAWPPSTMSSPAAVVIVSPPPVLESRVQTRSMSVGSPSATVQSIRPLSPNTIALPSALAKPPPRLVVMVSLPTPPSTMSRPPRPVEIVSPPPIVVSRLLTSVSGSSTPAEMTSPGPPWPSTRAPPL